MWGHSYILKSCEIFISKKLILFLFNIFNNSVTDLICKQIDIYTPLL